MSIKLRLKSRVLEGPVSLLVLQEARTEFHLAMIRGRARISRKGRILGGLRGVKLNFGCGDHILPGWLNVDGWHRPGVDYLQDLRQPLPLADGSCSLIFAEHVLEHVDLQFRAAVLRELYRLLATDGVFRIVGPDCAAFAQAYSRDDMAWFRAAVPGCPDRATGLNDIFIRHFHRFVDDFDSLAASLREAGFTNVIESTHRGSVVPEINVDSDEPTRMIGNLYIEARKQPAH